jgi:peroxiredoxin
MESPLKLPDLKSPQLLFGVLTIGNSPDSVITLALDESRPGGFSLLYIDKNNNQDLTDDGEPSWDGDENEFWTKDAIVEVHYQKHGDSVTVPYQVSFYRYKARLDDSIIAYRNGYREGMVALKDTSYKVAVLDDNLNGWFDDANTAMVIDVDRDGTLNGHSDSPEYFSITDLFNIRGVTYRVKSISPEGGKIVITAADSMVAPKFDLTEEAPAPLFEAITLDSQTIDLGSLKPRVVLIDFWATWCKPWENNLSALQQNYERFHARGFEIVGVSLDFDLDDVREYLIEHKMAWPQIANGNGWNSRLVDLYGVTALPKNFLIDRKGIIRYRDLHAASLRAKIYELLNEPEVIN